MAKPTFVMLQGRLSAPLPEIGAWTEGESVERLFTQFFSESLRRVFSHMSISSFREPAEVAEGTVRFRLLYGAVLLVSNKMLAPEEGWDIVVSAAITAPAGQDDPSFESALHDALLDKASRLAFLATLLRILVPGRSLPELRNLSSGIDTPEEAIDPADIAAFALTHAYIRYGGKLLSRHELDLSKAEIPSPDPARASLEVSRRLFERLIEIRRLFLSSSLSTDLRLSRFAQWIRTRHLLHERHDHQAFVARDRHDYLVGIDQSRGVTAMRELELLVGVFAVLSLPLTIFFGLFSVTTTSELIKSSGAAIGDLRIILMFLASVAPAILLGAALILVLRRQTGSSKRGR